MEKKIHELLDKMTIHEKIGQLTLRGDNVFLDEFNVELNDIREGMVGALPSFENTANESLSPETTTQSTLVSRTFFCPLSYILPVEPLIV